VVSRLAQVWNGVVQATGGAKGLRRVIGDEPVTDPVFHVVGAGTKPSARRLSGLPRFRFESDEGQLVGSKAEGRIASETASVLKENPGATPTNERSHANRLATGVPILQMLCNQRRHEPPGTKHPPL
jgi:hypothetical protein